MARHSGTIPRHAAKRLRQDRFEEEPPRHPSGIEQYLSFALQFPIGPSTLVSTLALLRCQRRIQAYVTEQRPVVVRSGPAQLVPFLKDDPKIFHFPWLWQSDDFAVGRE